MHTWTFITSFWGIGTKKLEIGNEKWVIGNERYQWKILVIDSSEFSLIQKAGHLYVWLLAEDLLQY